MLLSEIPKLFEDEDYKIDTAIIQVSPPDRHGYCSLGTSVDCARSAVLSAEHGDSSVHISHFDTVFRASRDRRGDGADWQEHRGLDSGQGVSADGHWRGFMTSDVPI